MSLTHYIQLAKLHSVFHQKGLEIIAFPCNQFGRQAEGSPFELRRFADKMCAPFRIMANINVNEPSEHPVYKVLKQDGPAIKGDFYSKFLVKCGTHQCRVARYDGVPPWKLRADIDQLLSSA